MQKQMDELSAEERLLCQFCAALGREFSRQELLALFNPCTGQDLQDSLFESLLSRKPPLISVATCPSWKKQRYGFLDSALHSEIHNSIDASTQLQWHLSIAKYLEHKNENYLLVAFDDLARHYFLAKEYDVVGKACKTIKYLELCGLEALSDHRMSFAKDAFDRLFSLSCKPWFQTIEPCTRAQWYFASCRAHAGVGEFDTARKHAIEALKLIQLDPIPLANSTLKSPKFCWDYQGVEFVTTPSLHSLEALSRGELDLEKVLLATKAYNLLSTLFTDVKEQYSMTLRVNAVEVGRAAVAKTKSEGLCEINSSLVAECYTALAIALVNAALFYYATGSRRLRRESEELIKKGMISADLVSTSEDHVILQLKSSEYKLMKGETEETTSDLARALWACKFSRLSSIVVEGVTLSITANLFLGRITQAKMIPAGYLSGNECSQLRCFQIMCSSIAGDFDLAETALEIHAGLEPCTFTQCQAKVLACIEKALNPVLTIGLSLLMQRKYERRDVAVRLALAASKKLQQVDYNGLPLMAFHTLFFACYALLTSVQTNNVLACKPTQVRPVSEKPALQLDVLRSTLQPLVDTMKTYAATYSICRPQVRVEFAAERVF